MGQVGRRRILACQGEGYLKPGEGYSCQGECYLEPGEGLKQKMIESSFRCFLLLVRFVKNKALLNPYDSPLNTTPIR